MGPLESTPTSSTPTIDMSLERGEGEQGSGAWQHRLSASFAAMAEQIAATSQTLAVVPTGQGGDVGALVRRVEELERIVGELAGPKQPEVSDLAAVVGELSARFELEQQRLPARLHNARATVMKATLVAPVTATGKPAPGFPNTRGEFEHITKERYDGLLKAYGLPTDGDTAAKRDRLRTFLGMPRDGQ